MPDARCTRGLVCDVHKGSAHEHTGQRRTSDIPCAMALRLIRALPGERLFCLRSALRLALKCIDASTAASGPHVFAVRSRAVRYRHCQRPPHPSHDRDDHDTPLWSGRDGGGYSADLGFGKTEIFSFEIFCLTHFRKTEVICQSGKILPSFRDEPLARPRPESNIARQSWWINGFRARAARATE